MTLTHLWEQDPSVAQIISNELNRQRTQIELIASENFTSSAVLEAVGSVLTNKYSEGYPGKRYYGGCHVVDEVETLALERLKQLFNANFANVQPYSGSTANFAAFLALVKPGDKVLGMSLAHGGHLTHGLPVNFSGAYFEVISYGLDPHTEYIDMDELERLAKEHRPKMIIAGASAYPRIIDFERFGQIAKEVGAYLMVDMAHVAGLIATGHHPSPVPHADVVTSTSHKTLRGPRGGFLLCNSEEIAVKMDRAVFPGCQGGPLQHVIAGKAVAFGEALKPEFKRYSQAVIDNMKAMGDAMINAGLRLVSGGSDNHLALVDLTTAGITGKDAERILDEVGITVNKNSIPNETRSPFVTSGIRIGSAAMTTRGFNKNDAAQIGELIAQVVFEHNNQAVLDSVKQAVAALVAGHPLYLGLKV